jgi:hypothetical protein
MEPEGSLPNPQKPATRPYPGPDQSSQYHRKLRRHLKTFKHFMAPEGSRFMLNNLNLMALLLQVIIVDRWQHGKVSLPGIGSNVHRIIGMPLEPQFRHEPGCNGFTSRPLPRISVTT